MTRFIGNPLGNSEIDGIDMQSWDLDELHTGTITASSATSVTVQAGGHTYVLAGHDFTFDASAGIASLTGGTITGLNVYPAGTTAAEEVEFRLYDFTMAAATFNDFAAHNNVNGFQRALFSDLDGMKGGGSIDTFVGMGGDDRMAGGDGNDILMGGRGGDEMQGDGGADRLTGGAGSDRFFFAGAADSGGGVYDTITDFDAHRDRFMLPIIVEGVNASVDTSSTVAATSEAGLAAALDASHLGAYHAAVATITVSLGVQTYLVVDINGIAGYQSGQDVAVLIPDARNLAELDLDNFILS